MHVTQENIVTLYFHRHNTRPKDFSHSYHQRLQVNINKPSKSRKRIVVLYNHNLMNGFLNHRKVAPTLQPFSASRMCMNDTFAMELDKPCKECADSNDSKNDSLCRIFNSTNMCLEGFSTTKNHQIYASNVRHSSVYELN